MTPYLFDDETRGTSKSACTDGCAAAWPPLKTTGTPQAGDGVAAELATFEGADGATQVAAGGWPLYRFADDVAPGDAGGQAVGDSWCVLAPDGTPKRPERASVAVRSNAEYGDLLVDGDGTTLDMSERDERGAGKSACTGDCASAWPPL